MAARILVVAFLLYAAPSSPAPPASDGERSAARLHARAAAEFKKGQLDAAIDDWRAAEQLHGFWKYAFNLAAAFASSNRWEEAEQALSRAVGYGIEEKYRQNLDDLRVRIEAALGRDHALIELLVTPEGATVTRNGAPWAPPWRAWVKEATSQLRVTHPGMKPAERRWEHPIGSRARLDVALEKLPERGTLVVVGVPSGAEVRLDGAVVGRLPRAEVSDLAPGPHEIRVVEAGFEAQTRPTSVAAGQTVEVTVSLKAAPRPVAVTVVAPVPRLHTAVWGWATLGTGAAALATGAAMYGWAGSLADDVQALNAAPGEHADFQSYADDYDAKVERRDSAVLTGHVLMGVGAALAVTGGVLLLMDGVEEEGEATTRVSWTLLPSGAAVQANVRF